MKAYTLAVLYLFLWISVGLAQRGAETPIEILTTSGTIRGSFLPVSGAKKVVLIIAGSGPTDRNGNNPMMANNSLKKLAEGLQVNGLPSVRYDKRNIAESKIEGLLEKDMRFEDLISDAAGWVEYLKKEKGFKKVIIIGHSEGSLIGMIAAQRAKADGFVSLAGVGQRADKILYTQLKAQSEPLAEYARPMLDSLVKGKIVQNTNAMLNAIFRQEVQPYLISWFHYEPQTEIQKLNIPVMIMQGTTDIQVPESEAKLLKAAKPDSKLIIIKEMNHILKKTTSDFAQNLSTYSQPDLPVVPTAIQKISKFCNRL